MSDVPTFHGFARPDGTLTFDYPSHVSAYLRHVAGADGEEVSVRIVKRRSQRSSAQNAAFHAGLMEWGASKGLTGTWLRDWVEDMKDDLLALVFGYVVRQNQLTGEVTRRLVKPHTSRITVDEFTDLFDVALVEAAKDGFAWRLPDDVRVGVIADKIDGAGVMSHHHAGPLASPRG